MVFAASVRDCLHMRAQKRLMRVPVYRGRRVVVGTRELLGSLYRQYCCTCLSFLSALSVVMALSLARRIASAQLGSTLGAGSRFMAYGGLRFMPRLCIVWCLVRGSISGPLGLAWFSPAFPPSLMCQVSIYTLPRTCQEVFSPTQKFIRRCAYDDTLDKRTCVCQR